MKTIAHRGDHTIHPGNTLPAFQAALDAGADGIEFDVRLTADLVPVVFHNTTLPDTRLVCNLSHDEIKCVRIPAANGQEYTIPTLRDVLANFGGKLYLELHVQPTAPEVIPIIGEMLSEYRSIWEEMEVTSYEPAILLGFQAQCAGIATDLLLPNPEPWMTLEIVTRLSIDKARLAQARAIHIHPDRLSPDVVEQVRSHGFAVHCWDVNARDKWDHIKALGAVQFTTDNIHLFI